VALICGLCWTQYEGAECPACKAEREQAKRVIEQRLRQHREEKEETDRPITDVEEWLGGGGF
jgi:Fe-S cluster biogenesis protein NfuA